MFFEPNDPVLRNIAAKLQEGQPLSREDGLYLFQTDDLLSVGAMAHSVRRKHNGRKAYFVVNRHLNPTNVCFARCPLCAFGVQPRDPDAYGMSIEQAVERARLTCGEDITELHIVGGMDSRIPWSYYPDLLAALKEALPHIHLKAFTAVEIAWFAKLNKMGIEATLQSLHEAGLDSMPGGGAEIFAPEVRQRICDHKIDGDEWREVHRTAHQLGLKSNATMLYGHIEDFSHRVDHLIALRELQDETGGFQAFIPLAFHPENTAMDHLPGPSGVDDLKTLAVARLMLNNFPHIKAYWIQISLKLAQVALHFGADDIDGTIVEERITHAAGASTHAGVPRNRLVDLIRSAGFEPVQRTTTYQEIACA